MNTLELKTAQARFRNGIKNVIDERKSLHRQRERFVNYFTIEKIGIMSVDDFALGVDMPDKNHNFCYGLERILDGLGRIIGANAFKFGIYFGRTKSDPEVRYRHALKFAPSNATPMDAFEPVRDELTALLISGRQRDIQQIASNRLSPMFKGKILSTYYPDIYLNVFSEEHLNYFIKKLDLDISSLLKKNPVYKRLALVNFKNGDAIMKDWSLDLFMVFLYEVYPGRPIKAKNEKDDLSEYDDPVFPNYQMPIEVNLEIRPAMDTGGKIDQQNKKKPNYELEARKMKMLGDRGEKIAIDFEIDRLIKGNRRDLTDKIERISLISDGEGYDILSSDLNDTPRYIEVKATTRRPGPVDVFISANEIEKAKNLRNYYLYIVFDILETNPKVWVIPNPFAPENPNFVKKTVNYRLSLNGK